MHQVLSVLLPINVTVSKYVPLSVCAWQQSSVSLKSFHHHLSIFVSSISKTSLVLNRLAVLHVLCFMEKILVQIWHWQCRECCAISGVFTIPVWHFACVSFYYSGFGTEPKHHPNVYWENLHLIGRTVFCTCRSQDSAHWIFFF